MNQLDIPALKSRVEAAIETLLRAADTRVSWKQVTPASPATQGTELAPPYSFLPGVYQTPEATEGAPTDGSAAEHHGIENSNDPGSFRVLLHGDNTFHYSWTLKRPLPRAMEYKVEMTGDWHKPVLNRSRRGDEDQRMFLTARRIHFQRLSNYDAENQTWKLCLKTLTRQGSDWAAVGETERGIPPIVVVFTCGDGVLESTGAVVPSHVLTNSPACRVLAGLTKKIANKLGGPIDVMTDKWLPGRHHRVLVRTEERALVKAFNPFFCLAEALRSHRLSPSIDTKQHGARATPQSTTQSQQQQTTKTETEEEDELAQVA